MKHSDLISLVRWRILAVPSLVRSYFGDCLRYGRYSATFSYAGQERLIGRIVRYYHSLEKGLSLKDAKPVFGVQVAARLLPLVQKADAMGLQEVAQIRAAKAVMVHYARHVGESTVSLIPGLQKLVADCAGKADEGGVISLRKEELLKSAKGNFEGMLSARRSVRFFDDAPVDEDVILKGITMAQQSPSVCNRQPGRAYYTTDPDNIRAALSLQDGNRGFGHFVKALIVVASDLSVFGGPNERNQAYIDGGLFAMTLMYSLTYLGIATCPLNWMADDKKDRELRELCGVTPSHSIIMLIAAGYFPNEARVAKSCRRDIADIASAF